MMTTLDEAYISYFKPNLTEHAEWLGKYGDAGRLARWKLLLKHQPEPAICEALVRAFLLVQVDDLSPNEDLGTGGPDYLCVRAGTRFYVETTCLLTEAVTETTKLEPTSGPTSDFQHYNRLTEKFKSVCVDKSRQCANLDAPCLLAICTLHPPASALCFSELDAQLVLTSSTMITARFDSEQGEAIGPLYQSTDLGHSSFIKPSDAPDVAYVAARRSVSGMLLCGFGAGLRKVHGVLHPDAVRPFDPESLPQVPFSRVRLEGRQLIVDVVNAKCVN